MMNKTLYCAISSHGFGHVAQTAPVLNRLAVVRKDINFVIQSAASREWLQQSLHFDFTHVCESMDFGMSMKNALEIDSEASHQRYLQQHREWDRQVGQAAELIGSHGPDLVFSNVAYLPNAAAAQLSIPSVNLCCLNWYGIYRHYCQSQPGAAAVLDDMLRAYNSADLFLVPAPAMPMPEIERVRPIGTIARIGQRMGREIRHRLQLSEETKLVLVSHGGVGLRLDFGAWPQQDGLCYLVAGQDCPERADFFAYESLHLRHIDILGSCDTIVTKPGYGTFAEAACNAVPVLYTRRPDWPEDPYLVEWIQQWGHAREVSLQALQRGEIIEPLQALVAMPAMPAVEPAGIDEAVEALLDYL